MPISAQRFDAGQISTTLTTLLSELVDGAPESAAYMLNQGDPGMLASLDHLSASAASTVTPGGSSIAAHVDHVRYGLSLMNRWANGEPNPFATANWSTSWEKTTYSDAQWRALRQALRDESHRWLDALGKPRDVSAIELNGVVGSIAHLAYHLGAIRQMDRAASGPKDAG
jgi:hypothetical protein